MRNDRKDSWLKASQLLYMIQYKVSTFARKVGERDGGTEGPKEGRKRKERREGGTGGTDGGRKEGGKEGRKTWLQGGWRTYNQNIVINCRQIGPHVYNRGKRAYGLVLDVQDTGHITADRRLCHKPVVFIFFSFLCPFVRYCFKSTVSSTPSKSKLMGERISTQFSGTFFHITDTQDLIKPTF